MHSIIESSNLFNNLYYIYISLILKFDKNLHTSLKECHLCMYFCFRGFSLGELYFLGSLGFTPTKSLENNVGNCLLTNGNAIVLKVPASKT